MKRKALLPRLYRGFTRWFYSIPGLPRNIALTFLLLFSAYCASSVLITHTGGENNSALVFVLAVTIISSLTTGYIYGILASVIGTFFTNTYFMAPYAQFSLSTTGYPVAMLSMLTISFLVCGLTSRVKHQAAEAVRRERSAKALYEQNQKLNAEKTAIELESARETIRSNILRSVSHDLRTPLTSISGSAAVLLNSPETAPQNLPLLRDIKDDADSLIVMVENLLSITRIQDTTIPLKKRDEMLEEVVGTAVLTTRRRFPHCKTELELSEDILYLPMEPMLVKQVIMNLLENAIRHAESDQPILIRLLREQDWAVVEVRDHGKGLSPEVCQAVKEGKPLNRDQSGDTTRGMGIGLSVCQSIIKAHNGFFTADNNPEGGAVFRFGLPMEDTEND